MAHFHKKGQAHLSETVAVIFIFFVLILFGLLFYYRYQQVDFKEKQEQLLASRAIDITTKTLFLPELLCSRGEAEPEDNCLDILKLDAAQQVFQNNTVDYYFGMFSYATITIKEIYPVESDAPKEWVLYNKTPPKWTRKEPTFFVVTLKDDAHGEGSQPIYKLGYLLVEVYS